MTSLFDNVRNSAETPSEDDLSPTRLGRELLSSEDTISASCAISHLMLDRVLRSFVEKGYIPSTRSKYELSAITPSQSRELQFSYDSTSPLQLARTQNCRSYLQGYSEFEDCLLDCSDSSKIKLPLLIFYGTQTQGPLSKLQSWLTQGLMNRRTLEIDLLISQDPLTKTMQYGFEYVIKTPELEPFDSDIRDILFSVVKETEDQRVSFESFQGHQKRFKTLVLEPFSKREANCEDVKRIARREKFRDLDYDQGYDGSLWSPSFGEPFQFVNTRRSSPQSSQSEIAAQLGAVYSSSKDSLLQGATRTKEVLGDVMSSSLKTASSFTSRSLSQWQSLLSKLYTTCQDFDYSPRAHIQKVMEESVRPHLALIPSHSNPFKYDFDHFSRLALEKGRLAGRKITGIERQHLQRGESYPTLDRFLRVA